MAGVNPTYQGNNFEEWYKALYGKPYTGEESLQRADGMSDVDWDIGQSLLKHYTAGQTADNQYNASRGTLEEAYGSSVEGAKERHAAGVSELERYYGQANETLDKNKIAATQQANRTYELMKKYLPEQLKENGLAGSGFSESTMLGAYSTHANSLGQIESDYTANKTALANQQANERGALDTELNSDLRNYETEKNTKLSELEQAYLGKKAERELDAGDDVEDIVKKYGDEEKAKADRQSELDLEEFNATYEALMELGEYERAEKYLDSSKELLGDLYDGKKNALDIYKEYAEETEKEVIIEGESTLKYKGEKYKVKEMLRSDSNFISRNNDFKAKLAELGYSDPYDSNIPNGTVIEFKGDNRGSNDFNWWDDVGAAITPFFHGAWDSWANWNTFRAAYYDGEWYLLENA